MNVLIVDDHPLVREGVAAILSTEYSIATVEQAATCDEAVKKIQQLEPDIVLLDLRLDKEYGLEVIPRARKIKNNCKFVVLTSSADRNDFKRAEDLDVDGYIL